MLGRSWGLPTCGTRLEIPQQGQEHSTGSCPLRLKNRRYLHMTLECRLAGFYTTAHDCAVVTAVSRAPSDSRHGRTHFLRGVRGLQRWIDYLWRRKHHYYLGEWHFHPGGPPRPSFTDTEQMKKFAASPDYQCPEPLLVIIGGTPPETWTVAACVFPRGQGVVELLRVNEGHI